MSPVVKRIVALAAVVALGSLLVLWGERTPATAMLATKADTATQGVETLGWKDLLPQGTIAFKPLDAASDFPEIASAPNPAQQFGALTGFDPDAGPDRADDPNAPRLDLAGRRIALAGYMTPLMVENGRTRSFLLVPYVGACVHVPAPPPNQIVLVEAQEPIEVRQMWLPFKAVGKLHVETIDTGLAKVGYTMELERIEPYEDEGGALEGTRSAGDGD